MNRRQRREARRQPIPVDCTRPLNDQLTTGQLAWLDQWFAANHCPNCGWGHTPKQRCVSAAENEQFLREIADDEEESN